MPHFKEDGFGVYLTQPHVRAKEWNCLREYDTKSRPRVKYVERFKGNRFFIVIRIDPGFKYGDADALAFKLTISRQMNFRWLAAKPSDKSQAVAFIFKVTLDREEHCPELVRRCTIHVESGRQKESCTSNSIERRETFNKAIGVSFAAVNTPRCSGDVLDFYQFTGPQLPGQHVISVHNFKFEFQAAETLPAITKGAKVSCQAIANPRLNAQMGWVDMVVGRHPDRALSISLMKTPETLSRARSPNPSGGLKASAPSLTTDPSTAPPKIAPDTGKEHIQLKDEIGERILDALGSIPLYTVPYKRAALEEGLIAAMPKVNTDAYQPSSTASNKRAATHAPDADRAVQRPKVVPERESAPAAVSKSINLHVEAIRKAQMTVRAAMSKVERVGTGNREPMRMSLTPTEGANGGERSSSPDAVRLAQKGVSPLRCCTARSDALDSAKAGIADSTKRDGTSGREQALKPVVTAEAAPDFQPLMGATPVEVSMPVQRPGLEPATSETPFKKAPSESLDPAFTPSPAPVQPPLSVSTPFTVLDEDDEEELELELRKIEIQQRLMRLRKQKANIKTHSTG